MIWLSARVLPILVAAALWLNPVFAHAFAFTPSGSSTPSGSGTPVIWEARGVIMSLNLGSPGSTLINGTTSWDRNAEVALAVWNAVLRPVRDNFFTSNTIPHSRCNSIDRFNTIAFGQDKCGDGFGDA